MAIGLRPSPAGTPSCDASLRMSISLNLPQEKTSLGMWSSHMEENKALAAASAEPLATSYQLAEACQLRELGLLVVDLSR